MLICGIPWAKTIAAAVMAEPDEEEAMRLICHGLRVKLQVLVPSLESSPVYMDPYGASSASGIKRTAAYPTSAQGSFASASPGLGLNWPHPCPAMSLAGWQHST